jgi:hypothetical protein
MSASVGRENRAKAGIKRSWYVQIHRTVCPGETHGMDDGDAGARQSRALGYLYDVPFRRLKFDLRCLCQISFGFE